MRNITEYIKESRTNPTLIAKLVKTWVQELSENPKAAFDNAKVMIDSIKTGLIRGLHEYDKKLPDDVDTKSYIQSIIDEL